MPHIGVSVVDGGGETPGPIPNPEAKPARADGTAPGREWESRLPPTQQLHTQAPAAPTLMVRRVFCYAQTMTHETTWVVHTNQFRARVRLRVADNRGVTTR